MTNEFDLMDHPMVFSWFKDFIKNEPLGYIYITEGKDDLFIKKWGKPDGELKDTKYWKKDYLGITIYVYSNQKVTYYKVQYLGDKEKYQLDKKMGSYLTGFLNKLIKEIV